MSAGKHVAGASGGHRIRQADVDRFYLALGRLADQLGGPKRLRDCTGSYGWPRRGVYFFFEDGEARADGNGRVVRVGTHALTPASKSTLWGRLSLNPPRE